MPQDPTRRLDPSDQVLVDDIKRALAIISSLYDCNADLIGHLGERLEAVDPAQRRSSVDLLGEVRRLDDASEDCEFGLDRIVDGLAEILPEFARFKTRRDLRRLVDPVPGQPDGYPPGALERHGLRPYRPRQRRAANAQ